MNKKINKCDKKESVQALKVHAHTYRIHFGTSTEISLHRGFLFLGRERNVTDDDENEEALDEREKKNFVKELPKAGERKFQGLI